MSKSSKSGTNNVSPITKSLYNQNNSKPSSQMNKDEIPRRQKSNSFDNKDDSNSVIVSN